MEWRHQSSFFKLASVKSRRNYVKKVFLKNSENSQEKNCARVSFLIKKR